MPRPRRGYARKGKYAAPQRGRRRPREDGDEEFQPPPKSKGPALILGGFGLLAVALVVVAVVLSNRDETSTRPGDPTLNRPAIGDGTRFCASCKGTGKFDCKDCERSGTSCSTCVGYGWLRCQACNGTGR
ncbi:MAG: hypothetical protein O6952_00410 [Planctomycetota bacterium]|nr:hypothetical protein [Planctomycetota bacterium]